MSALAIPDVSRMSDISSSIGTWHVGISPGFPSSLVLSNDSAIETILTDIPFLSVGLLGFGVLTFFFAMRKFTRVAFYIFASVVAAFIAGVLDVGQVLIRGRAATDSDTEVSSVLPLLIARELLLALSIGIRFFFFWSFTSQAPRGERPVLARVDSQEHRPNFLRLESDFHSASWMRLGFIGGLLKYSLLLAVLAIPVLQVIWRLVGEFSRFGPVYDADSFLEIVISALLVIKLSANAWLSPLTPRWKTIRDYSPAIIALLIGLGIGVGNVLRFQFSETSLGRFLQAVELYILVVYVLISSFYKQRSRVSMLDLIQTGTSKTLKGFESVEGSDQVSTPQIIPTTALTPENIGNNNMACIGTPNPRPANRLSSWLVPDVDLVQGITKRISTVNKLTSWITDKGNSAMDDPQSQPWAIDDMESGTSSVEVKTSYAAFPETSTTGPREDMTWNESVYIGADPSRTTVSQRLERITTALNAPPSSFRDNAASSPDGTISSFSGVEKHSKDILPPKLPNNIPGSPVYGLDGIVGYYGQPSPDPRPDSIQSSGMESFLRQQAELDKSVAELQLFSPGSRASTTLGGKLAVPGGQPESFRSDFSLSNFPEPPPNPSNWSEPTVMRRGQLETADQSTVVTGLPVSPKPSRIHAVTAQSRWRQSFPSISRSSSDSAVLGAASRIMIGSGGTQYDVTSFIGDLTTPALKESFIQTDKQRRPVSLVLEQPDLETIQTVHVKPTTNPMSSVPIAVARASSSGKSSHPWRMKQGLLSRTRLNISSPIPKASVERSTAYERPRPVPPA